MSYIAKVVAAGTLSAGAIGGASYAGYHHFTTVSFSDKLGISVLNLIGEGDSAIWSKRLVELKATESGLDDELTTIKTKEWKELRDWCNNNSSNSFNENKDTKYKNFEKFCTWKVEDKLTGHIPSKTGKDQAEWKKAYDKLKLKAKSELSLELQAIRDLNVDNDQKTKMHEWCTNSYKKTWTGENDTVLAMAKEICKST